MTEPTKTKVTILPYDGKRGARIFLGDIEISQYVTELNLKLMPPGYEAEIHLTTITSVEINDILASVVIDEINLGEYETA